MKFNPLNGYINNVVAISIGIFCYYLDFNYLLCFKCLNWL